MMVNPAFFKNDKVPKQERPEYHNAIFKLLKGVDKQVKMTSLGGRATAEYVRDRQFGD